MKPVEIQLKTEGAQKAAEEINKPAEALGKIPATSQEATKAIGKIPEALDQIPPAAEKVSRGFGGMLDGVPERLDEVEAKIDDVTSASEEMGRKFPAAAQPMSDHLGEITDRLDDASGAAQGMEKNVAQIARAQKAQALAQLAQAIGQIGTRLRETAAEVREYDAEMADSLDNTGEAIEKVSGAVSTLALGFAVGGPLGAGIAAVTLMVGEAINAFEDMTVEIAKANAAERQAIDMQQQLEDALAGGNDAYWAQVEAAEALVKITDESTAAIDRETSAIESRNRILNADDAASRAKRDREDAAKIRAGAVPEDVKIARAKDDAAMEKRRLDREIEAKNSGITTASNAASKAQAELDVIKTNTNDEAIIADAQKKVDALNARLDKLRTEAEEFELIAKAKRSEIDAKTGGKIDALKDQKEQRIKREADQTAAQQAEQQAAAAAAELARRQAELDAKARDLASRIDRGATLTEQRGGTPNATAGRVADRLSDGTNQRELETLSRDVEKGSGNMTAAMLDALRKTLKEMEIQAEEIQNLKGQMARNRTGR